MLGAIIGDIVGSRFEWNNIKHKDFEFFSQDCFFTDDSVMTIAIGRAILDSRPFALGLSRSAVKAMREVGQPYPACGFGGRFNHWMYCRNPEPYNSYGNGAAMRVSPCAWAAGSLKQALKMAETVTAVTHNHPEGIRGALATTAAIYMARTGCSMQDIRREINDRYYPMNFTLDGIRNSYRFNETCQNTVPQALMAFFESDSFEDAIRNAISIGGDSDTLAAITGSVAHAYYGVPEEMRSRALGYLDERLLAIYNEFEQKYMR